MIIAKKSDEKRTLVIFVTEIKVVKKRIHLVFHFVGD